MQLSIAAFGKVTETCSRAGVSAEWAAVLNGPADTPSPALDAVALACLPVWDSLIHVLEYKGWTIMPAKPTKMLTAKDLEYIGSVNAPKVPVFDFLDNASCAFDPVDGLLATATKGGGIQKLILPEPVPGRSRAECPTATMTGPRLLTSPGAVALTTPAGTLGGFAFSGDEVWAALFEYYNTAGRDNWGLVVSDRSLSGAWRGPYRVGPANVHTPVTHTFHANKCHDNLFPVDPAWAAKHAPGKTMASFRFRPNGAFQGAFGPALYIFPPDSGGSSVLAGSCLLAYPNRSQWNVPDALDSARSGIRGVDGEDLIAGTWIYTKSGKSAVLYGMTKGRMTAAEAQACATLAQQKGDAGHIGEDEATWYGFSYAAENYKGFHAHPYEPLFQLYDPEDFGAVADGALNVWDPTATETWVPDFIWEHPAVDGVDPTVKRGYIVGLAWDPEGERIYVMQTMRGNGTVIHVLKVK